MTANRLTKLRVERVMKFIPLFTAAGPALASVDDPDFDPGEITQILMDYYRVMEIAHFIRRGGVKAMLYRVETGKTKFQAVDYFDEAHERLASRYRQVIQVPVSPGEQSLLEALRAIGEDEEKVVSDVLLELDRLLLADRRSQSVLVDERPSVSLRGEEKLK